MPVILPVPELPPGPRSALVIATGRYDDSKLRALRAPGRDATSLAAVLRNPLIGGFDVTELGDVGVQDLRVAVEEFLITRTPQDMVLVYLSCHGLLDARRRLYFAAKDTKHQRLASTALDARWLLERLEDCRARQQVVILDCCFSGAFALSGGAKGPMDVDLEQQLGPHPGGRGRVVLTASRATEYSFEGDTFDGEAQGSVFTSALVQGLRSGSADLDGDGLVGASEAYRDAYGRVRASGEAQTPQIWTFGGEGEIILARSAAGVNAQPEPLPAELEAALRNGYPAVRAAAVEHLAEWLTSAEARKVLAALATLQEIVETDIAMVATAARAHLDRYAPVQRIPVQTPPAVPVESSNSTHLSRLAEHAEKAALAAAPTARQHSRLLEVVRAVALTDPERAERIAVAFAPERNRQRALARAVSGAADGRHVGQAKRIASTISDPGYRTRGLLTAFRIIEADDPEGASDLAEAAETSASSVSDEAKRAATLSAVAVAVARGDRLRAERIARAIDVAEKRVPALLTVATAVRDTDPSLATRLNDQAERAALAIAEPVLRTRHLLEVAEAVTDSDPAQAARLFAEAEQCALTITGPDRAGALFTVLADQPDPPTAGSALVNHALDAVDTIDDLEGRVNALLQAAQQLAERAPDIASYVASEAERTARAMADPIARSQTMRRVVVRSAAIAPTTAERALSGVFSGDLVNVLLSAAQVAAGHSNARHLGDLAIDSADRQAGSDQPSKDAVRRELAATFAPHDWALAEYVAKDIDSGYLKALATVDIISAVGADDPERAERLAAQAEQAALTIADGAQRSEASAAVLDAGGTSDPLRAERLINQAIRAAHAAETDAQRATALTRLIPLAAEHDADQLADEAEQAARGAKGIEGVDSQVVLAGTLAELAYAAEPERAMRLADQAERIALAIADDESRAHAIAVILTARWHGGF